VFDVMLQRCPLCSTMQCLQCWPEPYLFDRVFGDFPAKNTVHTPKMYGCGQP